MNLKSNILLLLVMILAATYARAEKSYVRDRAECAVAGEKFAVEIRAKELLKETPDEDYGEIIQVRHGGTAHPVKFSDPITARYRFLRGRNDLCPGPLAISTEGGEAAIFLARDNRPYADTLAVLHYNPRTHALRAVTSKITTRAGLVEKGVAYFKQAATENSERYGTIVIKDETFHYAEKTLEPWIAFDGKSFRLDRKKTYDLFEQKALLKPSDLDSLSEFRETRFRLATDSPRKRSCLSMNSVDWTCSE